MLTKIKLFLHGFVHAWRGLLLAFKTERNFRIHTAAALIIAVALCIVPLAAWEKVILLLVVAAVLVLELINSVLERMVDLVKPRLHQYVGDIKDLMAGAVLVAAVFAVLVGVVILGPHVKLLFNL
jgi:diacylglycerol kinase